MTKGFEGRRFDGSLRGEHFDSATFFRCDFREADCVEANFANARFEECQFQRTNMRDASLSTASFNRCDLTLADLRRATLGGARISRSALTEADFSFSQAGKLEVLHSDARRARWGDAKLTASMFIDVDLRDASLTNAELRHASFHQCDFTGADLAGAFLARTILKECELSEWNGLPREPWDIRITNPKAGMDEDAVLARWLRRAAIPFALGLGRADEGQLYASILEAAPALEEVLTPDMIGYGVLARWFAVPRIYALPTTDPEKMIYVGLVGELNGPEDALLLDGSPGNLAIVARAAGVSLTSAADAGDYALLATRAIRGTAIERITSVESSNSGWLVHAETSARDALIVHVTAEGAVAFL